MKTKTLVKFFLISIILITSKIGICQVSLSSDDVIDVPVQGYDNKFTVIRDGRDRNQWYYMPDMPRLVEKDQAGKLIPEFSLIRYQYHNDKNLEKLVEGGFLQFGVTFQMPKDAFVQVKDFLEKKYGSDIRFGSVIFKSAQVSAYTPVGTAVNDSSTLIGSAGVGSGVAPVFSTQKMVFSFPYNKIASNVISTLTNSQTGIPVFVTLNYIGLTPKVGFHVEWDWKLVYHHYSKDTRFRASASYFGLFGASYDYSAQQIYDALTSDNAIKVTGITGEGFSAADLDKYLQPILARINAEIVTGMQPPAKVSPAVANNPSASGSFFSAGYSVAIKNEDDVRSGKGSFDFNLQNMVERTTIIGGFIGIGNYSDEIKKKLILNSTEDDYKSASIMLPGLMSVDLANELKINKIDLSLSLVNDGNESERNYVASSPTTNWNWQDHNKKTRFSVTLPLMDEWTKSNGSFKDNSFFSERMNISTDLNYTIPFERKYKAYTGDGSINSLSDNRYNVLEISPATLGFKDLDNAEKLIQITVLMQFDGNKASLRTIKPIKDPGSVSFLQPPSLKYIIPNLNSINELKATVIFYYKDGIKKWKYNNQNLKNIDDFKDGLVILQSQDIQQ